MSNFTKIESKYVISFFTESILKSITDFIEVSAFTLTGSYFPRKVILLSTPCLPPLISIGVMNDD